MVHKCIFPVAGYGTRFLPATKSMPKEMLPIVDKPLIQYAAEEAMEAGLFDLGFINGRNKRAIPDHFDINYELENEIAGSGKEEYLKGIRKLMNGCTFTYRRQMKMKGLGHAILTADTMVNEHPFGVILADDLCVSNPGKEGGPAHPGVMAQMAELFEQHQCSILAVQEVPMDQLHNYGVVAGANIGDDLIRVTDMVEKPDQADAPSNLAVIGRYILTPDIFDILRTTPPGKNGEVQLTDAILQQAKQGKVLAYKFKGLRFDCGSVKGYVEATNWVYENLYGKSDL